MKNIYPNGKNPFAGKKVVNFKKTFIYPNEGNLRFQIQIDKNNQIYEILESRSQTIKDPESGKTFVKIRLGSRPRTLYDHVKGRPFVTAVEWIDEYLAQNPAPTVEEVTCEE